MAITHYFELTCDHCQESFEDMHERAVITPAEVRAHAKKQGWSRERPCRTRLHDVPVDLCPHCNCKSLGVH
jgi:2-iminoacetate synthase ThiH